EVAARITANAVETSATLEVVDFEVVPGGPHGWIIRAPLQPPHVFSQELNVARTQEMLRSGTRSFLPNSLLIRNLFDQAGWQGELQSTIALSAGTTFRSVEEPAP